MTMLARKAGDSSRVLRVKLLATKTTSASASSASFRAVLSALSLKPARVGAHSG